MSVIPEKQNLLETICNQNELQFDHASRLSGGDINEVFLLVTKSSEKFVIKINSAEKFPGMFAAEKEAMQALRNTKTIDIPKIISNGKLNDAAFLMLEYRSSGKKNTNFWEDFGESLAMLHKNTRKDFGFTKDNYIGSLPQPNNPESNAASFYREQRLKPQFQLAEEKGYSLGNISKFMENLDSLIPDEVPALIHGDLWNGNYLVNSDGKASLIDPAVAYAPREMDLAMMKLFGGFDNRLFSTYNEVFPLEKNWQNRIELWQLYYLLVHLNLFGKGYKASVVNIMKKYI